MNKAEEQFRVLFEQATEGIFISDSQGHYLDANPAACSMLGYSREEITRLSIADVITDDEQARLAPEMENGKRDGYIKNHWKFKRKDQSVFIGEVKAAVLSDGRLQATVRNVTEAMLTKEIISRNENRSRLTLDNMLEGCQIMGYDWRYLYLNRTAEIHNRRSNKELLGKRFMDVWPGIEETEVFTAIKRALEDRIPSHFEFYFRFPDGGQGWYDLSIHPVPEGVFILSIDITDRKKAENALRESEEKYRVVSENTDDWIYWVSPLGRFKYISPACEWITGYKPQEFIDHPSLYMEIVVPEDKEKVHNHNITPVEEQIIPHSLKFRIITKKGDLCWIDHSCTPVFSDGEYQGQLGTNRNITELKLTEQRQYESELKFRKIFEEGPFGMALMNGHLKTLIANSRLCSMLGFSESELQKRTFRDITAPEDVINDIQQIRKLIAGESSVYKTEKRYVRKDGQVIWGSMTVTANFSDEGQFLHYLVIIEDITRRKQAEKELKIVTERLRLATSVSNVGIIDLDLSQNHIIWDEKIYELYGLDPEQVTPSMETWLSRVHPDDLEYVSQHMRKINEEEKRFTLEFRILWSDQSLHWISAEGQIFRDDKGNPVRMIGVNYDITNRKKAEQELITSKAKLETAIASMTDAIFISDHQGQLIEFNDAFATFHKFRNKEECNELIARYPELVDILYANGEPVPFMQWAIPRALGGEKAQNEEYIVKRKDTGESWVASFSFAPIRDAKGQIIGTVVAGRDITESRKAEEALKESEERYRNIFESAVIGIYRTSPDGNIIMANPTLIRLLGFDSLEELMQRNLEEEGFENEKHREEFRRRIEKEGAITSLEAEWKTKDGRSVFVSENARAFYDHNGKAIYYEGTIEDITERKLMERTIRESEERFRQVFFTNPDSISIKRMDDGIYVSVNKGFTQIFGYSEEDIIGKTNKEFSLWVNADSRKQYNSELNKNGIVQNFEAQYRAKDGKIIHALVSSVIIEIEEIKHILSTARDITELKRAEEAIRNQEALLNEMGRIAKIGGWEIHPDTQEVYWTREVASIHDLEPTPSINIDTSINYYYGSSRDKIKEALRNAEELANPFDLELQIVSAKGVLKWVRLIGRPVVENEKVVKVLGSFQDITKRKETEEALRKSEENFKLLMESISLPVAYINRNGEIIFRNTKFMQMFGYTLEELPTVEQWWIKAFPDPAYREKVMADWELFVMRATEAGTDIESDEYWITAKDGKVRIIVTSGVIINDNILITLIDVTDRKRDEAEIRKLNENLEKRVEERTAQLIEANKELEAFSYSVSHDLRAPLRHINGFVDLLSEKYSDLLPDKGKHYLRTIVESSNHMGTLIDDLLQFSRTGRQEMQIADLDMNLVVQEVLKLLTIDVGERRIEWKIAQLPGVKGDSSLLRMVWYNLLSNAVKFTRNKQMAVIEIGFFEDKNNNEFIFFVKDNGAGFDIRYVHKLFGVFQRLHSKQEFDGTGIGLANVRRIVQKHGGRTWAESQPEQGATFYFTIPKDKENNNA